MTVKIPGLVQNDTQADSLTILSEERNGKDEIILHNKKPIWNEESQSYVLNFNGRVSQASIKNFQLVTTRDRKYTV